MKTKYAFYDVPLAFWSGLLGLILSLSPVVLQANQGRLTPHMQENVAECRRLIQILPKGLSVPPAGTNLSQVQRMQAVLEKMSPEQRSEFYKTLSTADFNKIATAMNSGHMDQFDDLLKGNGELAVVVNDFVDFGEIYPGIFGLSNADQAVFRVLDLVRKTELKDKVTHPDLLRSLGQTGSLKSTINSTLANLIHQATVEYMGVSYQTSGIRTALYNMKRFIFPTYSPVRDIIYWAQDMQRQLYRIKEVDRAIVQIALNEATSIGLTNDEVDELLIWVLNSPKEIKDLEEKLKKVFGAGFGYLQAGEIGFFDIYKSKREIREIDLSNLVKEFDEVNIKSLDELVRILSKASSRKGRGEQKVKDYQPTELQIRFEAAERQVARENSQYFNWTSAISNEEYTVEESYQEAHTRLVTKTDSDGKTTTETETYYTTEYRNRSVEPSFERILSRNFDTGDRGVWGLDEIRSRTSKVAAQEKPARSLMNEVENFIEGASSNYTKTYAEGKLSEVAKKAWGMQAEVLEMIKFQEQYANWSEQEIKAQYSKDNVSNFKGRNGAMLARLIIGAKALDYIAEAASRPLPQLYPNYELYDFSDWMRSLKDRRNFNYGVKFVTGAAILGAGAAAIWIPEVNALVGNTWTEMAQGVQLWFENLTSK